MNPRTMINNSIATLIIANKLLRRIPPFRHVAWSRHATVVAAMATPLIAEASSWSPAARITYIAKATELLEAFEKMIKFTAKVHVARNRGR